MTVVSRFLSLIFLFGALGVLAQPLAVAETMDASQAFGRAGEAFERIRTDYVDEVDDSALFKSAVLGMVRSPNLDARVLDSERIRRALKLGSRSRNAGVIVRALQGVYDEIRATRRVPYQALVDAAIEGMISGLDHHSLYLNPQQWLANQASQETGGIGLNVAVRDGGVQVVSPILNGPADRAGIVAGDVITAIDGVSVAGRRLEQVVASFRGPLDSAVVLTLVRDGKSLDVKLVRARVLQDSIHFRRHDDIGYIQIVRFNLQTADALKSAIAKLQSGPDRLAGYVVDLRDNAGGLLEQAVAATEMLLGSGLIATTRGRNERAAQRFEARSTDLTNGLPLVLLVNQQTAAGAEIMAAALQEQRRASVVGMRSFGAGTIQTVIPLGEHGGALRLTTSRVHTASGRPLEGHGVTPDVVIEQRTRTASAYTDDDEQLRAALKVLHTNHQR